MESQGGPVGLVEGAISLAGRWLDSADLTETATQRRQRLRFQRLIGSEQGVDFTRVFVDRVMRLESPTLAARALRQLVSEQGLPQFLGPIDRALTAAGAAVGPYAARLVMPLAERRVRAMLGDLIGRSEPAPLRRHLTKLRSQGFGVNVNLLGEAVLGEDEAQRRLAAIVELARRPEVDYVSVKVSAVASQLHHWAHESNIDRISDRLTALFEAARDQPKPTFVNLDMEAYRDLDLTVEAFTRVLERKEFAGLDAGLALQAYLPDTLPVLDRLLEWARDRQASGGGRTKIRLVKGANLAMERLDAASHGWTPAPLPDKETVDANYLQALDMALQPDRLGPAWIGVASHNLFDLAHAHLLAKERGVDEHVVFEMLSGMASAQSRAIVRDRAVRLYLPVVAANDFDAAVAYLFRRLEENTAPENFLTHSLSITSASPAFADQAERFRSAVGAAGTVAAGSRRWTGTPWTDGYPQVPAREGDGVWAAPLTPIPQPIAASSSGLDEAGFTNRPDADPTDPEVRAAFVAALGANDVPVVPAPPSVADVDSAVDRLRTSTWAQRPVVERAEILDRFADLLDRHRAELVGVMAHTAAKTIEQGDPEVSEAADFARYYAGCAVRLGDVDGASFTPYTVVTIAPPWNFPLAIPVGGVVAALAAGAAVAFKPAPDTREIAALAYRLMVEAGIPGDAVAFLPTDDDAAGHRLITHPDVDAVILTGATETAELFRSWRPDLRLHAETSGKNSIIVTDHADLDAAVSAIVTSAFGHAGQKCSAASLAILVGEVGRSERFRRQLRDAAASLTVGMATDVSTDMTPTTPPPTDRLRRALTQVDGRETWLLEPRALDDSGHLWSPGIRINVQPGSWFHRTECFGPVLGLIATDSLEEAIAIQNGVDFGLTGGLHSLESDEISKWLATVEVGNAYVNRHITGAIVRRQPFGGWKASVVGPAAKAGGPNMVASLGTWHDDGLPTRLGEPAEDAKEVIGSVDLDPEATAWLRAAVGSDQWWWRHEFGQAHDPTGLSAQANVLRYLPLPRWMIRLGPAGSHAHVVRALAAAGRAGVPVTVSCLHEPGPVVRAAIEVVRASVQLVVEPTDAATGRAAAHSRVQIIGNRDLTDPGIGTHVEDRPVVASGRVMLPRLLREQSISYDVHRFGHVARTAGAGSTTARTA